MGARGLVLAGVLLLVFAVSSAEDNWYQGVVILKSHEVIVGKLTYEPHLNIVQVKAEGRLYNFSAFQVLKFTFHDTNLEVIRKFEALPHREGNNRFSDTFFEIVIAGEMKLIRKKRSFYTSAESGHFSDGNVDHYALQHTLSFDYYYQLGNQIIEAEKFKRHVLPFMKSRAETEVELFIFENRLNVLRLRDQVLLVKFYNKFIDENNTREFFTAS